MVSPALNTARLAMKAWLDGLVARNVSTGRFGSQALQQRLDRIWDDLLFALPRYGRSPVLAYQKAGGRMSLARWYYVFRTLLSR